MGHETIIGINAIAYSLGSIKVDNHALGIENPEWDMEKIFQRTGVRSRNIASKSETALDLGEQAALGLIKRTSLNIDEIDALIFCTQSPDFILPPNSTVLHGRMGMGQNVMAFDITHACSGYVYGLGISKSLIMGGLAKKVLFVTADTYSSFIDPRDRSTRPIFGDAAAATLITASPMATILDLSFYTDGTKFDRFYIEGGASYALKGQKPLSRQKHLTRFKQDEKKISMDGLGVLSFFSKVVPEAVNKILEKNNLSVDEISFFIFHQASKLALDAIQKKLQITSEKMIIDIEDVGNLVSSSIPVAFSRLMQSQKLNQGQYVLLCGFGVGLSWGCTLVQIVENFNGPS